MTSSNAVCGGGQRWRMVEFVDRLFRFCSEKAKKLLRNMPKSCSKVAQN